MDTRRTLRRLRARQVFVSLDTNVLVYAENINGAAKKRAAIDLLQRLLSELTLIAVQAFAVLFIVLVR